LFSVSGESKGLRFDVLESYFEALQPNQNTRTACLKFVHNGTREAWDEMENIDGFIRNWYLKYGVKTYIMPVGGTVEAQTGWEIANIAEDALHRGYWVAARTHVYLFGNAFDR